MRLVSVYKRDSAPAILYRLLAEREAHQNISHRQMPSWEEHVRFYESLPYEAWYLIEVGGDAVGATYLSKAREIGIFIFRAHQGCGYGAQAVRAIMAAHPGRFLANIAPTNERSIGFFQSMGFKLLQITYAST